MVVGFWPNATIRPTVRSYIVEKSAKNSERSVTPASQTNRLVPKLLITQVKMASGPVSRILYDARFRAPWRSFLGPADRSAAQAAYPRVITGRADPPLLFGLAPRGVCRAAGIAACAVGSYPTVSPLPCAAAVEDPPEVSPPTD